MVYQVDSHLLREDRKRWLGPECGFSIPTSILHISVGWQFRGWQGHVGRGIPSYQDISDHGKGVEGGSEWKVEDQQREK